MAHYIQPNKKLWKGRPSVESLYLYQKVKCLDLSKPFSLSDHHKSIALLGYQCDEGVRRNGGRVGAKEGPNAIRKILGTHADHLEEDVQLIDFGDVVCEDQNLEQAHELISEKVKTLLDHNCFPVLLGGGHDLAYAHFQGIKNHLSEKESKAKIGIINLDAHFDLRAVESTPNSGTPFYQIGTEDIDFNYLCLGIQPHANNKQLYSTAEDLGVEYLEMDQFSLENWAAVSNTISVFIDKVDSVYLTIDLDGFSSAYASGVSAPSPMGFDPAMAHRAIHLIVASGKLISSDIVELNPTHDSDENTAKLAAWIVGLMAKQSFS